LGTLLTYANGKVRLEVLILVLFRYAAVLLFSSFMRCVFVLTILFGVLWNY